MFMCNPKWYRLELRIHFSDVVTKNLVIHFGPPWNSLPFGSFDPPWYWNYSCLMPLCVGLLHSCLGPLIFILRVLLSTRSSKVQSLTELLTKAASFKSFEKCELLYILVMLTSPACFLCRRMWQWLLPSDLGDLFHGVCSSLGCN